MDLRELIKTLPHEVSERIIKHDPKLARQLKSDYRKEFPAGVPREDWINHLIYLSKKKGNPFHQAIDVKYCANPRNTANNQCPPSTTDYLNKLLGNGLDPLFALNEFIDRSPTTYYKFWDWDVHEGYDVAEVLVQLLKETKKAKKLDKDDLLQHIIAIDKIPAPKKYEDFCIRAFLLYVAIRKKYISMAKLNAFTKSLVDVSWNDLDTTDMTTTKVQWLRYLKDTYEMYVEADSIKYRNPYAYVQGQNTSSISREYKELFGSRSSSRHSTPRTK